MKEAAKHLQEELQKKDEQLTAFKAKTKAYVESKNKQHAEALQAEQVKLSQAQAEVSRLQQLLEGGGRGMQSTESECRGDTDAQESALETDLRVQLADALAACERTKQQSRDYIMKAKAASERVKADLEEQLRDLQARLSNAAGDMCGEESEQKGEQAATADVGALQEEVEALRRASQEKEIKSKMMLDNMRDKVFFCIFCVVPCITLTFSCANLLTSQKICCGG